MSENERAGQQQRYCKTCGKEIRPENTFCTSCGTSLRQGPEGSGTKLPDPPPPDHPTPLSDVARDTIQGALGRLGTASTGPSKEAFLRLPGRAVRWFRNLSSIPKLAIAGVVLLILLTLLSPLALLLAGLLLGISVIALIIQVSKGESLKEWGILAGTSLVMLFVFGGISLAMYGGWNGTGDPVASSPEERAQATLEGVLGGQVRDVTLTELSPGTYRVDAVFSASNESTAGESEYESDERFVRGIEADMRDSYAALFTSDLAPDLSQVELSAHSTMVDFSDGSESDELIFKTSMDDTVARDINWENAEYVKFANVWEVEDIYENYDPVYSGNGPSFQRYSN